MTIGLVFQWSAVVEKKRLHHFLIIASKTTCYVAEGRELHPNGSTTLRALALSSAPMAQMSLSITASFGAKALSLFPMDNRSNSRLCRVKKGPQQKA